MVRSSGVSLNSRTVCREAGQGDGMRCTDIVYKKWPERLDVWIRVEKKLGAIKTVGLTGPAENVSTSLFDSEEVELINNLLQLLVSEYERKHGPVSYIVDKGVSVALMIGLRELVDKLT